MNSEIDVTSIDHKKLRPLITKLIKKIKKDEVIQKMFKDYKVSLDELDLVPICFAEIPVSARTDHGVIFLNIDLLKEGNFEEENDHYLIHELTHFLQQTTGNRPTKGSDDDSYLDNPVEQEAFQNQTEYVSENKGEGVAERYVSNLLDHHEVKGKDRAEKFEELLKRDF